MTRNYNARVIAWKNRRPIWRLSRMPRKGLRPVTDVGDYVGHPGKSGLRKIRESFLSDVVTVSHVAPDQFNFKVKT